MLRRVNSAARSASSGWISRGMAKSTRIRGGRDAFHSDVIPAMDALRAAADDAETICGEDYWPLPSYSKMLYYV